MQTLRIMTYNVHSCIGMDGKLAPERIAHMFVDVCYIHMARHVSVALAA